MKARVGRLLLFLHYFIRSVPAALDPFYDYDYIFYSTWHDFFSKCLSAFLVTRSCGDINEMRSDALA